jgi:hypothetical protein
MSETDPAPEGENPGPEPTKEEDENEEEEPASPRWVMPATAGLFLVGGLGIAFRLLAPRAGGLHSSPPAVTTGGKMGDMPGGARAGSVALRAQEEATKANLGLLRSSIALYYGSSQRKYPENLQVLVRRSMPGGKPLAAIPTVTIGDHSNTNDVQLYGNEVCLPGKTKDSATINWSKIKDTGKWGYVGDESSPCQGIVFVDCSHKDTSGAFWHSY